MMTIALLPTYKLSPKINALCNSMILESKQLQVLTLLTRIQFLVTFQGVILILPLSQLYHNLKAIGLQSIMLIPLQQKLLNTEVINLEKAIKIPPIPPNQYNPQVAILRSVTMIPLWLLYQGLGL
jgi:hypothetical protein